MYITVDCFHIHFVAAVLLYNSVHSGLLQWYYGHYYSIVCSLLMQCLSVCIYV